MQDSTCDPEFLEFRETLLNRAILVCAVLGLPAVAFSVVRVAVHGWHPACLVHATGVAVLLGVYTRRHRISYRVKSWVFLTTLLVCGGVGLVSFGLAGGGFLILFLFSTLCTVFAGPRAGGISVGAALGLSCLIGGLIVSGHITLPEYLPMFLTSWAAWTALAAGFGMLSAAAVVVVGVTLRTMERSYAQLRQRAQDLDSTVARLEEENSFSETLINMLPGSFAVLNEKGRIVRWNQFGIIRYGHTIEEIRSRFVQDWVPKEEQERVLQAMRECFEQGEASLDVSFVTRDGRRIPHIFNGKRIEIGGAAYALVFGLDITEQREAERELSEKQGLLKAFLDNSPGAVFVKDLEGRFILANRVTADILNTSCEEIEGKTPYDLMPREIADQLWEHDRMVLRGGETLKVEEVVPFRDALHTFLVHKFALEDSRGKPYALAGIALDITEAKLANERLQQLQTDLAHADRLRTLGELATGLAHELNQPLVCLNMYAQTCSRLLAEDEIAPVGLRKTLDDIVRDVDRAIGIVKRFRAFGRNGETRRSSVGINQLLREVVAFLEHDMRQESINVQFALADGLPRVFADSIQIQQVVVNLLMNSIQAIVEGDTALRNIRIETAMTPEGSVRVVVQDSGPGLAQENRDVFEPFVTTKSEGMGLGLSISRTIIEEHEGRIFTNSNPDPNPETGAEFGFVLPVDSDGRRRKA